MPQLQLILFAGLLGLAMGSFLNVVIDRLPRGESIVNIPSHCDVCGHRLRPWDLVPVLSYVLLGGRCRYCRARITPRIPMVELTTGALYFAAGWQYGAAIDTLIVMTFASVLLVIVVVDLEHQLILNRVTYPSAVIALVVVPWGSLGEGVSLRSAYLDALYGALLGGGLLGLIYLLARGGFGLGDVKLGVLLGLMLGFVGTLVTLQVSFILGGVVAIGLLAFRVRRRKDSIPFGPFLAGAGIVSLFWGQTIFNWYQGLFS